MERTVLEFPRGITGVVGPNGCGKSNIVDALRWVLGEQSARHLRGQSMEDVIFAGNERHGPLGGAEVTITFDNEEGLAHLAGQDPDDQPSIAHALAGSAEIEVTRRLYRSGESEYEINGRPCRLRDITELFLGTGVGTKAYSIIEQGRVGQIVGAKPEELRLFVEEAAGTTLYRSRKLAAERKIERTRDNLNRVSDIIRELDRQAVSLRRQARGAARYSELKKQEGELDRRLNAARLRRLGARVAQLEGELGEVRAREAQLAADLTGVAGERDQLRSRQLESERMTEQARKSFYDARGRVSEIGQTRQYLADRIVELERRCQEARGEAEQIGARVVGLASEDEGLQAAQQKAGGELVGALEARTAAEARLTQCDAELFELGSRMEEIKASLVEALARQATIHNERSLMQRDGDTGKRKAERLAGEGTSLGTVASKLIGEIQGCQSRLDDLIGSLAGAEGGKEAASARLSNLLARRAEAESRAEDCRAEVAALGSRYDSLRELNECFEGYGDGVRSFMSNGGKEQTGAAGVVADFIDIEAGYERAVAAVLQERLQYVVVPDPDAGVRGAVYLRETGTGRASFIPQRPRDVSGGPTDPPSGYSLLQEHVRAEPGYEAVVESLLEGVVVADTLEAATQQWKLNGTYVTFVTRDGDVLDKVGVITGGSGRPLDEGLVTRKSELRALEQTLTEARRNAREAGAILEKLRSDADAANQGLEELDREVHELTVARVAAEGDLALHRQNLARTEERLKAVTSELDDVGSENRRAENRLAELAAELEAVAARRAEGDAELARLEAHKHELAETRASIAGEVAGLRVREAELRQQQQAGLQRLQSLRAAIDDEQGRRGRLESRLREEEQELVSARERLVSPELDLDRASQVLADAEAELDRLQVESAAVRAKLDEVQTRLEELTADRDRLREERGRIDVGLTECRLEREAVDEGLRERLGVGAADVLADQPAADEDDPAGLQAELERVRSTIHRLGTVNVGALADLEDLETRLAELTGQRDDLDKSIEALRGTIARLNRLSRQRFKETFDAVNEIFRQTFPRLFQGGTAYLALTDENNLLETGVEIYVRPPGKKVGNLDLLSGGEKALTAVSLIFSLFLHKPSPFCVLDEVDAPLDDANIARFARMVADMSARSQFVLITHNKKTMECCDVLYGVTMREPGVSKIVSVEIGSVSQETHRSA